MSPARTPKYWFAAKRYGWGWGLPCAWQGWVVFISYLALVLGGLLFLRGGSDGNVVYGIYLVVISVALVAICWITGEPPRWRWGERDG
jgi:hypothetical protein